MDTLVDISGLSKAAVLAALFNAAAPIRLGFFQAAGSPDVMTEEDAQQYVDAGTSLDSGINFGGREMYFDYVRGCSLKVKLSGDSFDPWGFDHDNGGDGAAQRVIDRLRETGEVTCPEQEALTRDRTLTNAYDAMAFADCVSSPELGEPLKRAVDHVVERVSKR